TGAHMRSFTLAFVLFAAPALASVPQRLALPVGSSSTVSLHSTVSKVTVADPSKVEIKKQGRKIIVVALEKGTTEATIRTKDGETRLSIYVAADKYAMPY